MGQSSAAHARDVLLAGLGRRDFLRVVAVTAATGSVVAGGATEAQAAPAGGKWPAAPAVGPVLQPGKGRIDGDAYLPSRVDQVGWGYVTSEPVMRMRSGRTVTIDAVSHEGMLEDQGRNPADYFASHYVRRRQVLHDAVQIAREYDRHPRNFDGPHIVTGPIFVEGAEPGDVLKMGGRPGTRRTTATSPSSRRTARRRAGPMASWRRARELPGSHSTRSWASWEWLSPARTRFLIPS